MKQLDKIKNFFTETFKQFPNIEIPQNATNVDQFYNLFEQNNNIGINTYGARTKKRKSENTNENTNQCIRKQKRKSEIKPSISIKFDNENDFDIKRVNKAHQFMPEFVKKYTHEKDDISEIMEICTTLKLKYDPNDIYEVVKSYVSRLSIFDAENIDGPEYELYKKGNIFCGGLIYLKDNKEFTNMLSYDYNSAYGAYLKSSLLITPLSKPELKTIDSINLKEMYGYYKLNIISNTHPELQKIYNPEYKNQFFHNYDIMIMDEWGIKYELKKDKDNALLYDNDNYVTGKFLFGDNIDKLYDLKLKGNELIKTMLRIIYGVMSQRNFITDDESENVNQAMIKFGLNENNFKIYEFEKCFEHVDYDKFESFDGYRCINPAQPYKSIFARIKYIITALGRLKLSRVLLKVKKQGYTIQRINTDGFVSDITENEMNKICKVGSGLGEFKIEKKIKFQNTYRYVYVNRLEVKDNGKWIWVKTT